MNSPKRFIYISKPSARSPMADFYHELLEELFDSLYKSEDLVHDRDSLAHDDHEIKMIINRVHGIPRSLRNSEDALEYARELCLSALNAVIDIPSMLEYAKRQSFTFLLDYTEDHDTEFKLAIYKDY